MYRYFLLNGNMAHFSLFSIQYKVQVILCWWWSRCFLVLAWTSAIIEIFYHVASCATNLRVKHGWDGRATTVSKCPFGESCTNALSAQLRTTLPPSVQVAGPVVRQAKSDNASLCFIASLIYSTILTPIAPKTLSVY